MLIQKHQQKMISTNDFFELISNSVSARTMENVRKAKYIKLIRTEKRKNYLVAKPNYHTTKFFTGNFLAIGMINNQIHTNKAVCLG